MPRNAGRMLATEGFRGTIVPEGPLKRPRDLSGPLGKGGKTVAMYEAYCVKCRAKREFEGTEVELKNGRKAAKGA